MKDIRETIREKVESLRSPYRILHDIIFEYSYIYDLRADGYLECGLENRVVEGKMSKEAQNILKERMEGIVGYFDGRCEHTVGMLNSQGRELLELLDSNYDLSYFLDGGWKEIYNQYKYVRMNLCDLPRTQEEVPKFDMRFIKDLLKKPCKYSVENNCSLEEACFALIFLDKEFQEKYQKEINEQEEYRKDYESYKKFTDKLDKLEEKYG